MVARIKLGELLVRAGVLDEFKLNAALNEQRRWGGRLGKILVNMNFVQEDVLLKALSKQLALPLAKFEHPEFPRDVLLKVDKEFARLNALCPERMSPDRRTLVIAMADPINVPAVDEIRRRTGLRIETSLASERTIAAAISKVYGGPVPIVDTVDLEDVIERFEPQSRPENSSQIPNSVGYLFPVDQQQPAPPANPSIPPANTPSYAPQSSYAPAPISYTPAPAPPHASLAPTPQPPQYVSAPPPSQNLHPNQSLHPSAAPPSPGVEMLAALDQAQKKQIKAIRVMLDILVEKGVISRDEFLARVNRR